MLKRPFHILMFIADDLLVRVGGCQLGEGVTGAHGCHTTAAFAARRDAFIMRGMRRGEGDERRTDADGGRRAQLLLRGFRGYWNCEPPKEHACGGHHG